VKKANYNRLRKIESHLSNEVNVTASPWRVALAMSVTLHEIIKILKDELKEKK